MRAREFHRRSLQPALPASNLEAGAAGGRLGAPGFRAIILGGLSALLKVECYAGYKAAERPLRFSFLAPLSSSASGAKATTPPSARRSYEVVEVLDRWYGPGYECFRVRADDHNLYILRHQLGDDTWTLDSFRREPVATGGE